MKFEVNRNSIYKELVICGDNFTMDTGLLNSKQQVELALELLECVYSLVDAELHEKVVPLLTEIENYISNNGE